MRSLVRFFDCGNLYFSKTKEGVDYCVEKYSDLTEKIIPFFEKHPISGVKFQDYKDFCRVASLMKEKKYTTQSGLDEIREIKAGMNQARLG